MNDRERSKSGRVISTFTKRVSVTRDVGGSSGSDSPAERIESGKEQPERVEVQRGVLSSSPTKAVAFGPRTNLLRTDSKLAIAPFSVLLPSQGSVSQLQQFRTHITKRYNDLLSLADSGEEGARARKSEELMLNQVLKWLDMGSAEEE